MAKRLTHEEFVNRIAEINPNIEILGTFTSVHNKVLVKCKTCGYEWDGYPSNMVRVKGNGCRKCRDKNLRHSHEKFVNEMAKRNPNIKIFSRYENSDKKVKCECLICGHEWEAVANCLKRGNGCPECAKRRVIEAKTNTHESFLARMKEINPNIEFLSKYIKTHSRIKCKCKVCGYEWETSPGTLLSGCGCPRCAKKRRAKLKTKSHEDFEAELRKVHPTITLLSKYEKSDIKVKVVCDKCGYEWLARPGNLLFGAGCKKCAAIENGLRCRSTHEEFLKKLNKVNNKVEILSKYERSRDEIKCKCMICGREFTTTPGELLAGKKCPHCEIKVSTGERKIMSILDTYNVVYEHEYFCHDLKGVGNRSLSYDFYLPDYNMFIEYQGVQHDRPVGYFGGEEKFKKQIEHDTRKREFAEFNNINLLEIWYYDYKNIERILKEQLDIKEAV